LKGGVKKKGEVGGKEDGEKVLLHRPPGRRYHTLIQMSRLGRKNQAKEKGKGVVPAHFPVWMEIFESSIK